MPGTWVVIPVYNEERVVGDVVKTVRATGYEQVLVVDDGSADGSAAAAENAGALALRLAVNRGKGAAVKTGIEAAKLLDADIVVTMDGDGQHNPADIGPMLERIRGGVDVVLGTRPFDQKKMPAYKVAANQLGNLATWLTYGLLVHDSQSGFRAYGRRALELIETRSDRYEYDSEVIREIKRAAWHRRRYRSRFATPACSMGKQTKQNFSRGLKTLVRMIMSN
ncbi:MAG: glycosyltransferase family 2 protein [Candidatus Andersenbacteria bacterium]